MLRRCSNGLPVLFALLLAWSLALAAAEGPVVLQPDDPSFSGGEERLALDGMLETLHSDLAGGFPQSVYRLERSGWNDRAFAQYVAGRLAGLGYPSVVVETDDASGATRLWVLAGVLVGEDRVAYVPVITSRTDVTASNRLGVIAWSGEAAGRFDPVYTDYDRVVDVAANRLPTASIIPPRRVVVINERTSFVSSSRDPDGTIIATAWDFGDGETVSGSSITVMHTYTSLGEFTVTVTVYDDRGGESSAQVTIDVLAEDPGCGCTH